MEIILREINLPVRNFFISSRFAHLVIRNVSNITIKLKPIYEIIDIIYNILETDSHEI